MLYFIYMQNFLFINSLLAEMYLYNTEAQLIKKLKNYCKIPSLVRGHGNQVVEWLFC